MKNIYMQKAIDKAWKYQFLTYPNPAVGACIVRDSEILSIEAHEQAGFPHAEVLALKSAYLTKFPNSDIKHLTLSQDIHSFLLINHCNFFNDCEIFVTLEPCNHMGLTPPCSYLLGKVGIKKVYIGSLDENKIASGGAETLSHSGIEVECGVLKQKCDELLLPFLKWQKDNFKFFKLAIREDGTCDGGYITSQDSLNLVHKIRTKLDLLVIGGNTVRIDRPRLDSRFAHSEKASDVLILSKIKEYDKTIPLFHIPNRTVFIDDDLQKYNTRFMMIEGGFSLLSTLQNDIDMLMLFISHKDKKCKNFNIEEFGFKKIHSYAINEVDELMFLIRC